MRLRKTAFSGYVAGNMQFGLKSIFWLIFLVAVTCGVLFALPDRACCIVLLAVVLMSPAALLAGIVYGRRAGRAFAIGCLASGGWALFALPYVCLEVGFDISAIWEVDAETATSIKIMFAAYYGILSLAGLVSVGIWRLCNPGRDDPFGTRLHGSEVVGWASPTMNSWWAMPTLPNPLDARGIGRLCFMPRRSMYCCL